MNGLFRNSVKGMAHPAGDHHFDYRAGKAGLAGGSAGGEDQNAV